MLKKIVISLSVFLLGLFVFFTNLVSQMIYKPELGPRASLDYTDFKEFVAKTDDGINIYACFYQNTKDSDTVILCHGHRVTLRNMNDLVSFLRKSGYNVLLFDFRAHGESSGKLCTIGLYEYRDIIAVINQATELDYIKPGSKIIAYGRSMGAAALINGSSKLHMIDAFILESSFEKLRNVAARDLQIGFYIPDTIVTDIVFKIADFLTGIPYSQNQPVNNVSGLNDRPVLLIHNNLDKRADMSAFLALKKGLPHAETWQVPDSGHVRANIVHPEEFQEKFLTFISDNLKK